MEKKYDYFHVRELYSLGNVTRQIRRRRLVLFYWWVWSSTAHKVYKYRVFPPRALRTAWIGMKLIKFLASFWSVCWSAAASSAKLFGGSTRARTSKMFFWTEVGPKYSLTIRALCGRVLSSIKMKLGPINGIKGTTCSSKMMFMYLRAVIES